MEKSYFSTLIAKQAKAFGTKTALCYRTLLTDSWSELSWLDFSTQVDHLARAFVELGLSEQQKVGQFSQNKVENLVVDFALYANRAIMVPMYATSSKSQVEFIVHDASIEIIFVGNQAQYDIALEVLQDSAVLKKIIAFEPEVILRDKEHSMYFSDLIKVGASSTQAAVVAHRQEACVVSDLACILYTSGTTGNPKGVMMPHEALNLAMRTHTQRLTSVTPKDISIAFLPLSHVFERTWTYFCIFKGAKIYINEQPTEIQQTIKDVRPTLMCAVPRFWEKVYSAVRENLSNVSPLKLGIVVWALAIGKKYNLDTLRLGKKPDFSLRIRYAIADALIFSKVKRTIGIENANMLPCAGAKLSDDITLFFRSMGIPIIYGYGLTESTATVCCFEYEGWEIGTLGTIMPELEVKIGAENEILLRGKTIFPGYYNNPEATKAAFTDDGWFKTGDAGILKGNTLILTERIKDLYKTSNGKYIAPQEIETRLGLDPLIEQVAAIGDGRNFVTAIIHPSIAGLEAYAQKQNIEYNSMDELFENQSIKDLIMQQIHIRQEGMASYELIKKFVLIQHPFSMDTGELTNTLKLRRNVIAQKYKLQIEEMYTKSE